MPPPRLHKGKKKLDKEGTRRDRQKLSKLVITLMTTMKLFSRVTLLIPQRLVLKYCALVLCLPDSCYHGKCVPFPVPRGPVSILWWLVMAWERGDKLLTHTTTFSFTSMNWGQYWHCNNREVLLSCNAIAHCTYCHFIMPWG